MNTKRNLTPQQKKILIGAAAIEITAKLFALHDINHRAAGEVRGSKRLWRAALAINFFGPAAYYLFGRRKAPAAS